MTPSVSAVGLSTNPMCLIDHWIHLQTGCPDLPWHLECQVSIDSGLTGPKYCQPHLCPQYTTAYSPYDRSLNAMLEPHVMLRYGCPPPASLPDNNLHVCREESWRTTPHRLFWYAARHGGVCMGNRLAADLTVPSDIRMQWWSI